MYIKPDQHELHYGFMYSFDPLSFKDGMNMLNLRASLTLRQNRAKLTTERIFIPYHHHHHQNVTYFQSGS